MASSQKEMLPRRTGGELNLRGGGIERSHIHKGLGDPGNGERLRVSGKKKEELRLRRGATGR